MRPIARIAGLVVLLSAIGPGCQNANLTSQQASLQQQHRQQMDQYAAQLREAQRRANNLDVNNVHLNAQFAQSQQQLHRVVKENDLLKRRLDETANQLAQTLSDKKDMGGRVEALEASTRLRGGCG